MILQDTEIQTLARLLAPHMDKPAWPGLTDPEVKEAARAFAKKSGLWDKIAAEFDPRRDIPTLKRSAFRQYKRRGSRVEGEAANAARSGEMGRAALALWLEHPKADLDYLQDLIWAWCETTWWQLAAHEGEHIDLVSSARARELAEYSFIFASQLEPEVRDRISREVAARALDIALDYKYADWWQTTGNNWNMVCNANLIAAALYEIKDPGQLAAFIHPLCRRMDYAIDYFTDDGGCVEGAGYWEYGFINYVEAAISLYHRTGGAVNLMAGEKFSRISRFPMAAVLRPPIRASFADGGHGYVAMGSALRINQLLPFPELYQLVESDNRGMPKIADIRSLALYRGEMAEPYTDRTDYILPQLGYVKVHAAHSDILLATAAGSNGVSHNHNDIGTFILLKNGVPILTDPASPTYSAKTFGPHRYDMLVCRSKGHSVPIINGYEQQEGSQFYGTITAEGLNGNGDKTVTIDLSHAYPDPTLRRFERKFVIEASGVVRLCDEFEFQEMPSGIEEAFITFEPISLEAGNAKIGTESASGKLHSETKGKFELATFLPELHEGADSRPLHRLSFRPEVLGKQMRVEFTIR